MMKDKKLSSPAMEVGELEEANRARTAETLLRVVPIVFCLAALVLMIKNSETNDFGDVSYSNLGGFKYLVYANGLCAAFSLLSAFFTARSGPLPSMRRAWTFFFFDQVLTYAILAAGAVAAEILYLAYHGDDKMTWSEACDSFGGLCHKATASVGVTFGSVACYAALSLLSSYRLFSTFDPPTSGGSKGGIEVAAFPS
ncbi:CASP-like protein 2A1 [Aristolochia californica]|uniref:CASP-like protein 2A1 n=1 Tax=Aristolochia californica TaxID=171875 RepID=UPI0035DE73E8